MNNSREFYTRIRLFIFVRSVTAKVWRYFATRNKSASAIKTNTSVVTDTRPNADLFNDYLQFIYKKYNGDIPPFL